MQILADIAHNGIEIFQAPTYDNEDEETLAENEEITVRSPSFPLSRCLPPPSEVPY